MSGLDEEKVELLERQLAERITERVRPALFKFYAGMGATVIAVLGLVGWDVVTDLKSEVKGEILDEINQEIGTKRQQIIESTTETRILAKRANAVIQRVEQQLDEFEPQAEDLNETIGKVNALKVASNDFTDIYARELVPLIDNVETLSAQLSALAMQVDNLNEAVASVAQEPPPFVALQEDPVPTAIPAPEDIQAGGPPDSDGRPATVEVPVEPVIAGDSEPGPAPEVMQQTAQRSMAIQSVITEAKQAEKRLTEARAKPTVFLQFAGGSLEQAGAISAKLRDLDYTVPPEDRERAAMGKHEVRYFHDDDREAAAGLADDTTRALRNLGYSDQDVPDVDARSFVGYGGKKPRVGILELWLEIP